MNELSQILNLIDRAGDNTKIIGTSPGVDEIKRLLLEEVRVNRIYKQERFLLNTRLRKRVDGYDKHAGSDIGPIRALEILRECHDVVETKIQQDLSDKSIYQFLWISRRFPWMIFPGSYTSSKPYRKRLFETLVYTYGCPDTNLSNAGVSKKNKMIGTLVNKRTLKEFIETVTGAILLDSIQASIRWSGKGSQFHVIAGRSAGGILKPTPDDTLKREVDLYDRRMASPNSQGMDHLFQRTGTAVEADELLKKTFNEVESSGSIVWCFHEIEPAQKAPVPMTFGTTDRYVKTRLKYIPSLINLNDFRKINEDDRLGNEAIWGNELPSALLLSRLCLICTYHYKIDVTSLFQYGYVIINHDSLSNVYASNKDSIIGELDNIFPRMDFDLTFEEILRSAIHNTSTPFPLRKKAYATRVEPVNNVLIDLASLFEYLQTEFVFRSENGGSVDNVRADHFEHATQRRINNSDWAPPNRYADLRGRKLLHNDTSITDIDAIGHKDGVILLVDTKSRIYNDEYDMGDYQTVRNIQSGMVKAAAKWEEKVSFLKANPRGDNYDFSTCSQFVGVVCTPTPVYVPFGKATHQVADNLMRVCSLSELFDWMGGNTENLELP
jgi:hypothetical protein